MRAVRLAIALSTLVASAAAAQSDGSSAEPAMDPIQPFLTGGPAAATRANPAIGSEVELVLRDGQRLRGRFVARGPGGVTLDVEGGRITVPATAIRSQGAAEAGGARIRDSNRTRYLYSPSGFMLRKGEGYLSQTELLLSSVAYGVTDWLTVQAGTVLPIVLYDPRYTPGIFAVKGGWSPAERWHLAAGFQSFVLPTDGRTSTTIQSVGFLFGTATWGTEDLHLGVSAGPPFFISGERSDLGDLLVSISGSWRAFDHGALVSENWILTGGGPGTHVVGSAAYRFLAERVAVDVGLVFSDVAGGVPIPWLDFTWHWGT